MIISIVSGKDTPHLATARELNKRDISIDINAESTQIPKEEIIKLVAEEQRGIFIVNNMLTSYW